MDYQKELERIAQQYRDEGYAVITHPDKVQLPGFAADSGADLMGTRGNEKVLVQVKRSRADVEADPNLARQAEIINRQPGWRYDLVVLEPDNPMRRLSGEPTVDQINRMLGEAEQVQGVSPRAAFVLAWGALEAAMRRYAQRVGVNGKIGTQPLLLVRELYAQGHVSPEDFARLEETRRLRTEIVHGLSPPQVDAATIQAVVNLARRLLAEAEKPQAAVAG
jgi:hypothetical protein